MAFEMAIAVQTPLAPPDISSPNKSFANFSFIISTSVSHGNTKKPHRNQTIQQIRYINCTHENSISIATDSTDLIVVQWLLVSLDNQKQNSVQVTHKENCGCFGTNYDMMPALNTLHKGSHTQMRKCFRVSHIC
jgi:hypothetical protein